MLFKGKKVLITGGSSGVGAACARLFTSEGAMVAIVARNANKLKTVQEEISKIGHKPVVIVGDLTNDKDLERIVREAVKGLGCIDVLINNAGVTNWSTIFDDNLMEMIEKVFAINFRSPAYLTHLVAPYLVQTKGNIVNVSTTISQFPIGEHVINCSAKGALDIFTRVVAADLGPKGVRVNSILPGVITSDHIVNMGKTREFQEAVWEFAKKFNCLGRTSSPEEYANLILFLASHKSRGITGGLFVCDNGFFQALNLDGMENSISSM